MTMPPQTSASFAHHGLHRRILRNLAWVGSSQAVIAGLGLVSLALTARSLGAAGLGIMAVIEAYSRTMARILHPEPWQALIKHGAEALEQDDHDRFGRLVWLSMATDLALGLLTALVGIGLAWWAAGFMEAARGHGALMALAAATGLLAPRPTAMGLLRLYDRFDLLARTDMAIALIRLILVAAGWLLGAGLTTFVALFVIWTLADGIVPMVLARHEMTRRGHRFIAAPPRAILAENPGLGRLFFNSNINVTLRQLRQRLDIVFLATVMPAPALGLYQIARRIGDAALRLGRPVGQIALPEFSRLAAAGNLPALRKLILLTSLGLGAVILIVFVPFGLNMPALMATIFGPEFAPAAASVNIMIAASALYMAGLSAGPALMSLNRDAALAKITLVTTAIFFAGLIPAARQWGAEGAAGMLLLTNALWLAATLRVALQATRTPQVPA